MSESTLVKEEYHHCMCCAQYRTLRKGYSYIEIDDNRMITYIVYLCDNCKESRLCQECNKRTCSFYVHNHEYSCRRRYSDHAKINEKHTKSKLHINKKFVDTQFVFET